MPAATPHNEAQAVPRHNNSERAEISAERHNEPLAAAYLIDVQYDEIDQERNERPDLFRVPAPEPSPAEIGPARAENNAREQKENGAARHRRDNGRGLARVFRLKFVDEGGAVPVAVGRVPFAAFPVAARVASRTLLDRPRAGNRNPNSVPAENIGRERRERDDPRDRAERVAHNNGQNVNREPEVAPQYGDKRPDIRIEFDGIEVRGRGDGERDGGTCRNKRFSLNDFRTNLRDDFFARPRFARLRRVQFAARRLRKDYERGDRNNESRNRPYDKEERQQNGEAVERALHSERVARGPRERRKNVRVGGLAGAPDAVRQPEAARD